MTTNVSATSEVRQHDEKQSFAWPMWAFEFMNKSKYLTEESDNGKKKYIFETKEWKMSFYSVRSRCDFSWENPSILLLIHTHTLSTQFRTIFLRLWRHETCYASAIVVFDNAQVTCSKMTAETMSIDGWMIFIFEKHFHPIEVIAVIDFYFPLSLFHAPANPLSTKGNAKWIEPVSAVESFHELKLRTFALSDNSVKQRRFLFEHFHWNKVQFPVTQITCMCNLQERATNRFINIWEKKNSLVSSSYANKTFNKFIRIFQFIFQFVAPPSMMRRLEINRTLIFVRITFFIVWISIVILFT